MKKEKYAVLICTAALICLMTAFPSLAGWNTSGKKQKSVSYTDDATGAAATGLTQIGDAFYCFNEAGILQTGWVQTEKGARYFEKEGKVGERLGRMVSGGLYKIDKETFGFDEEGDPLNGLVHLGSHDYWFSGSAVLGKGGRAAQDRFVNLPDGRRAYFQSNCRMAYKKWVKEKNYYVDETGNLLRSTITPDGYIVNAKGQKGKKVSTGFVTVGGKTYLYKKKVIKDKVVKYKGDYYYFDETGERQTGWISWGGHDYYFYPKKNGKAATGTCKISGKSYTFSEKGWLLVSDGQSLQYSSGTKAETGKASILILCGHGQGDSGAVSGSYIESQLTRSFGTKILEKLKADPSVNAYMFNQNYDMYQVMRSTLGAVKNGSRTLQESITGSGALKKKTYNAVRGNAIIPDPLKYDYILEIHFNATAASAKDPGGNGSKKGTGTYVNIKKKDLTIDRRIISKLNAVGMPTWGAGVYGSDGLLNARAFQEMGVNYTLLETCFIDDGDDMKFYKKNADEMAGAVAKAIIEYFK